MGPSGQLTLPDAHSDAQPLESDLALQQHSLHAPIYSSLRYLPILPFSFLTTVQCLPIIPFSFLTELPFYLPILSFNFLSVTPAQHSTVQIPHYDTCSFYQSVSHFDTCPFYCSASSLRYQHILPFSFLTTIPAHSTVQLPHYTTIPAHSPVQLPSMIPAPVPQCPFYHLASFYDTFPLLLFSFLLRYLAIPPFSFLTMIPTPSFVYTFYYLLGFF